MRIERNGRTFRIDPLEPPSARDVVLLTWNWPEHLDGTAASVGRGEHPTVVADRRVLAWLGLRGPYEEHRAPVTIDGVAIETRNYTPIPYATPIEAVRKVKSALIRPDRAARRLWLRTQMPKAEPRIAQLTFPGGERLLYLNLALHGGTSDAWLDDVVARYGGADWLLAGVDYGEHEGFAARVGRLGAKKVLVADLVGDTRRRIGMPVGLLTPIVDRLRAEGFDAYVLAARTAMRFER